MRKKERNHRVAAVLLTLLFAPMVLAAEDGARIEDLERRIRALEQQLDIQQEVVTAKLNDDAATTAAENGILLKKNDFELKFNLLAQIDSRYFLGDGQSNLAGPGVNSLREGFVLRRLRPTFQGTLGKLVGFRLTPEFAGNGAGLGGSAGVNNSATSIVDAYFDLKFNPAASLRIGKQKGPIGLERLQPSGAIGFIERGYVTELVPNRDIGVLLYGETFSGMLNYAIGVFNGTADGRDIATTDIDNRHEIEGRIFAEPFQKNDGVFRGLGAGIAFSDGRQYGPGSLPQYRSSGQNTFFSYDAAGASANGQHGRLSPQLYWHYNNIALLGEYAVSKQKIGRTGAADADFTHKAYEITATYVLTGENADYKKPIKPRTPYMIGGTGWGAFEVAARTGALSIDKDAFTLGFATGTAPSRQQKATGYGIGMNWYLTQNAKLALDYDFTRFDPAEVAGAVRRQDERALFTRLQITY